MTRETHRSSPLSALFAALFVKFVYFDFVHPIDFAGDRQRFGNKDKVKKF